MEKKIIYVAYYKSEICNDEMRTIDETSYILNAFTDINTAKEYADEYYNNACGDNANMTVKTSKKGYLNVTVTDRATINEKKCFTEYRTLKIERVTMSNSDALTDIQNKIMD